MRRALFIICLLVISPGLARAGESGLTAGAAKAEITPETGAPLGGFGKRHGKASRGMHDPLYARSIAVSRNGHAFVFLSLDLVLVDAELRSEIMKKISREIPLAEEQVLITATHTHSGAGAYGGRLWQKFILGKKRKSVFEKITGGAAQAVLESLRSQKPVTAEYAETDLDGLVENRMDEKLNYPRTLKVLRFQNDSGKTEASLIFMAAHATILPASNLLFSADFPGALCDEVEKKTGGTALFINGAAADLRPHTPPEEDRFERMKQYSASAAEKWSSLEFTPAAMDSGWSSVFEKTKLPAVKIRAARMRVPGIFGGRVFPRHSFFQAIRMGNFMVFSIPGELDSETGFDLEEHVRARGLTPLLAGYANDYIAYIVSRRYYRDLSQYESQVSFYGSRMPWFVQQKAADLAEQLLSAEEIKKIRPEGKRADHEGLPVVKIRGDAYHLGFEEGRLLRPEIQAASRRIFAYFRSKLPVPLANQLLINAYLDRAWKKMEPYVSYSEYLQIKGLAEGSGVSFKTMKRLHALPEIYPSLCTNGAYWGKATENGRMIAVRNLDWDREIGIHNDAAVKWLETPGKKSFANIGYAGFSGVLSGMNENGISVGQIGAESKDETIKGSPMPFLLKRILERSAVLDDARAELERSSRTRGYNYVIASALENRAFAAETTRKRLAFFSDMDEHEKAEYAFKIKNAVFRGDPALDPDIRNLQKASGGEPGKPGLEPPAGSAYEIRYLKHGKLVQENYGKITEETARHIALEIAPGSNIQSVIYAFPEFEVANARGKLRAAETEYRKFNLDDLRK